MPGANEDEEKMRFKGRCGMIIFESEILILKKLLLPYTNPKIDRETEGEFKDSKCGCFQKGQILR